MCFLLLKISKVVLGFRNFRYDFWGVLGDPEICAGKFPLVSMGGQAEGLACADQGARTPIGVSGNSSQLSQLTNQLQLNTKLVWPHNLEDVLHKVILSSKFFIMLFVLQFEARKWPLYPPILQLSYRMSFNLRAQIVYPTRRYYEEKVGHLKSLFKSNKSCEVFVSR